MVTNAAMLGRSGVHDFVLLRASAIVLALYSIFIVGFALFTPEMTYGVWHGLFSTLAMKVFTFLALIGLLVHCWIGMWQVLTDYIKCSALRAALQFFINLTAVAYVAAGLFILWGVK
ncbi:MULTISPECIES: succinate dehydrogenase, hydrophobic membrane anchor protein [Corallincola]|uniref:Succinate dehydrogenase hydrophobic membrane anchor subunit n=3 Tax=Corallincola TaxID=1775176 RepID=A0A368NQW4_9GAMM|nr:MULTISPECIES: succinate dehydrogenase, hydrophobic membrane anchor protein [Corallincola]RCU52942.1 succinate dehydrogenase, hydrophobic membrane anchor protein [Corallincola holothuriorum]TAA48741.1 succinate dehydrogenase, hydrophobic membrane anchor protein [Corallincola spongiicola]TCI02542.1 succinate dehydrogenase, hydrophobic membrane anchor protein [Corallincola luteus]